MYSICITVVDKLSFILHLPVPFFCPLRKYCTPRTFLYTPPASHPVVWFWSWEYPSQ